MAGLHNIPPRTRWNIATSVLTRLVLEIGAEEVAQRAPGGKGQLFSLLSEEVKRIAEMYSLPRDNAAHIVQTLGAVSVILFGRSFETRYIEGFPGEGVIRLAECAMFRDGIAPGIPPSTIHAVCLSYVQSAVSALNPDYAVEIVMARCKGDPFCEMVISPRHPPSGH